MPLQIRRGNTAEVNSITPLVGELIYNTQTGSVLVGDGGTAGGVPIAGVSINATKDAAAASLLAGTHKNISFSYDSVTKALSATVDILTHETIVSDAIVTDKIFNTASTVVIDVDTATVNGTLIGSVTGDVKGSVFADDSTLLVDAIDGVLRGTLVGTVAGNVLGNVSGNVTGNTTGYHTGDVKGSVFADDSTLLVDAIDGVLRGTLIGNVSGSAGSAAVASTVDVTNTNGLTTVYYPTFTENRLAGQILRGDVDLSYRTDSNTLTAVNFAGNLTGTVTGNVSGNLTGDVKGSIFGDDSTLLVDATNSTIPASVLVGTFTGNVVADNILLQTIPASPFTISLNYANNDNNTSIITSRKSRGTLATPTTVVPGDQIFRLVGQGYDGSTFNPVASIISFVDPAGTVSSGIVPGKLEFYTTDNSGVLTNRLEINRAGDTIVNGILYTDQFYIRSDPLNLYTSIISHPNAGVDGSVNIVQRSRGTDISPQAVVPGDTINTSSYRAYSGTQYLSSSAIQALADSTGTVTTTATPGKLQFLTAANDGVLRIRLTIDKDGVITSNGIFQSVTVVPTGLPLLLLVNTNTVSDGARSAMRRSRGTFESPTTVVDTDVLFRLVWGGHDGTSYRDTASIEGVVSGAVSTGVIPTKLNIKTTDSLGVLTTAATVTPDQTVEAFGAIKFATYANPTARDAKFTVSLVQAGMVVFLTDSTGSGGPPKLQVNTDGTQGGWVDLH